MHSAGFEPATYGLEGSCSIRLSYECDSIYSDDLIIDDKMFIVNCFLVTAHSSCSYCEQLRFLLCGCFLCLCLFSSFAMKGFVDVFELLVCYVGVYLGCCDI